MRHPYLQISASLLVGLCLACTADDSSSTSESATSSTPTSSTGSTSSSGSATGNSSSDATDSEPSTSSTGTSTSGTTSTSTGDPTGTSTGGGGVCEDVGAVDFGDCATPLGWIFDGDGCVALDGCDCGPHCNAIFASASECGNSCAAAGECRSDLFIGKGLARGAPFGVGTGCDEVDICGGPSVAITEILPNANCGDRPYYPCEGVHCSLGPLHHPYTEEEFEKLCAASLLPGVDLVACVLFE